MFDMLGSDIVVMQELKIQRKDLRDDMVLLEGWDCYFSLPKHKKGYSGVGIYTRSATCAPMRAEEGLLGVLPSPSSVPYCDLPEDQSVGGYPNALQLAELGVDPAALDSEGRCLILEFPAFVLFGVYCPANSNGMRDDFRYGFICALDCRIRNLVREGKNVVLVGDLNVSRDELDTAKAWEDCRKNGITHEEYISTPNRRIFNHLLVGGEVAGERDEGRENGILWDTTRGFHPNRKGMYTHWEQKINARPGNYGSRIDFVLVSERMQPWIKDANIQEGLLGSDHCPVFADFYDTVQLDQHETVFADIINPPGVFEDGLRKREWKVQNVPAFSAKRMPEFDKRRSIMSMFVGTKLKRSESSKQEESTETKDASGDPPPMWNDTCQQGGDVGSIQKQDEVSAATDQIFEPPSTKRKVSVAAKEKPAKRQKADVGPQTSKGQQSLKGFFSAQDKPSDVSPSKLGSNTVNGTELDSPRSTATNLQPNSQTSPIARSHLPTGAPESITADQASQLSNGTPHNSRPPSPTPSASPSPSEVYSQSRSQRAKSTLVGRTLRQTCFSSLRKPQRAV